MSEPRSGRVEKRTSWDAFELRLYDSRTARWMSVDPYREFWSPYLAMGNNPINLTDPTGGHTDGIGVNNKGKVVYDDGKKDGNVYDFGDYDGAKLNSMSQVKELGLSFDTWAKGGKWLGSTSNFDHFVKTMIYATDDGDRLLGRDFEAYDNFSVQIDRIRQDPLALASTFNSGIIKKVDGKNYITFDNNSILVINSRHLKNFLFRPNELQFTLANEIWHLKQTGTTFFTSAKSMSEYARIDEVLSAQYQIRHWTRHIVSDGVFIGASTNHQNQIRLYRNFKKQNK